MISHQNSMYVFDTTKKKKREDWAHGERGCQNCWSQVMTLGTQVNLPASLDKPLHGSMSPCLCVSIGPERPWSPPARGNVTCAGDRNIQWHHQKRKTDRKKESRTAERTCVKVVFTSQIWDEKIKIKNKIIEIQHERKYEIDDKESWVCFICTEHDWLISTHLHVEIRCLCLLGSVRSRRVPVSLIAPHIYVNIEIYTREFGTKFQEQ